MDLKWNMLNCHELIEQAGSIDEAAKILAKEFARVIDAELYEERCKFLKEK